MIVFFLMTDLGLMTFWIEDGESSLQDWMVQPAWQQVLAVAAHQTICRGEIRMKTFSIGLVVLCNMPMQNIIQAIGSNGRWANSPRAHTYYNNEQVFPNWKQLLLIDHLSEDILIFLIVSDRRYTSYHSHHIKMFGNSEQVPYWCQVNEYCY